jgi:hypothetical protein
MREIFDEVTNALDILHLTDEDIGLRYVSILKSVNVAILTMGVHFFHQTNFFEPMRCSALLTLLGCKDQGSLDSRKTA